MDTPKANPNPILVPLKRPKVTRYERLIMVPMVLPGSPGSENNPAPAGVSGAYNVEFVFSVPGRSQVQDDLDLAGRISRGTSLVSLRPASSTYTVANRPLNVPIAILTHPDGVIKGATLTVDAENFQDAANKSSEMVQPWLSYVAFLTECAIGIDIIRLTEVKTGSQRYDFWIIGRGMSIALNTRADVLRASYGTETAALLSSYREGLNSLNVFWKFLSFWKVAEGVQLLRGRRTIAAQRKKLAPEKRPPERIPDTANELHLDDEEADVFKSYFGLKFNRVLDTLRESHRNAVAHLDPDRDLFAVDNARDTGLVTDGVPVIRYIARRMLVSELVVANPGLSFDGVTDI